MADDRDETIGNTAQESAAGPRPVALSRRAVLRGATAAVPTILTLHSGSALAIASNYVSGTVVSPTYDPKNPTGSYPTSTDGTRYVCLQTDGNHTAQGLYDVSQGVDVVGIQTGQKYQDVYSSNVKYDGVSLCRDGGTVVPQGSPNATPKTVRPGILASGPAYTSLVGKGAITSQDWL